MRGVAHGSVQRLPARLRQRCGKGIVDGLMNCRERSSCEWECSLAPEFTGIAVVLVN